MVDIPQICITDTSDGVMISGGGMLDLTNSEEFRDGLKAASETARDVAVDLRSAQFIDSAIVQYIANAAVRMLDRGKRLRVIVADGGYPQRVVKTVGFDALVDMVTE